MPGYRPLLDDGLPLGEAASALQKAIRRGHEEVAFWWAKEMAQSGYHMYVWKRLAVIASEDIGNADPMAAVLIAGLWNTWKLTWDQQSKKAMPSWDLLGQAILYLCRAPSHARRMNWCATSRSWRRPAGSRRCPTTLWTPTRTAAERS